MSLRQNLAWVATAQGLYFFLQFTSSVVIARLISPYEMGIYTVALATAGLISLFQEFGLFGFMVRESALSSSLIRTVFTINALLSILIAALILIVSVVGGALFQVRGVRDVLFVIAFLPLINAAYFVPETMLQREGRFRALSLLSIFRTSVSQALAIALAISGFSYMSLAYSQLCAAILSLIFLNIFGSNFVVFRPGLQDWKRVTVYGVHMLSISGVSSATDKFTDFILGRIAGLAALGLYSRATSLNNLLWENVHLLSGKVLFIGLADSKRNGIDLKDYYTKINDINTVILWPAFLGLAITSGPFIRLVYGERWVAAAHPLALISIASMIYVSLSMTWDIFVLGERTALQAKLETIRAAFTATAFAIGSIFGLMGAASARVLAALFTNELYRPTVSLVTGTKPSDFTIIFARNAVITGGAVLPATALMAFARGSEFVPLPAVLCAIAVGVLVWLALLHLFHHPLSEELKAIAARLKGRMRLASTRIEISGR